MEPKVIYEDTEILVLDKPSGITVNKSDTTKGEKTVQDWVEAYFVIPNSFRDPGSNEMLKQVQHDNSEADFYKRAGIAHRLDKETSGILLVAKTPEAFLELQRQFKERIVKKTYLALVHGKVVPEEGIISVPVGRLPWNRKRFGVIAGGRDSVTRYRVIQNSEFKIQNEPMTLLELNPETGRTHQIRVHLKHIGHPIFGDSLYGGRKTARDDRKVLPRVFLHAAKIAFMHPASHKQVVLESPLPDELKKLLSS